MKEFFGNIAASFKKVSKYVWAFVLLLVVFFTTQICVMGNTQGTGESLTVVDGKKISYQLKFDGEQTRLDDIYINVGAMYVKQGTDVNMTVKTTTSSSTTPTAWTTIKTLKFGNVFSATNGINGANYNWVEVAKDLNRSSVKSISFAFDQNVMVNEIACFAKDGSPITLTPLATASEGYKAVELNAAVDAQASFNTNKSAKYIFSPEESHYMTSIQTILHQGEIYEDSIYRLDADYSAVASLLMLPSVAIFGTNTFALRFPSLIAMTATLVFIFLLATDLFKDKKYGFLTAAVFAFGGIATSAATYGTAHSLVAFALVAALYFMYRFYSRGISDRHVVKGSMNVLISALFCALAVAMEAVAGAPALGVLALFVFGVLRMHKAHKLALSKTEGMDEIIVDENGEERTVNKAALKAKNTYSYKLQVSISLFALGTLLGGFLILLITGIICYPSYVMVYDTVAQPAKSFAELVVQNWLGSGLANNRTLYTAANATSVFAWLLPIKASTVYSASVEGTYLARSIMPNFLLTIFSFVSLLLVTAKVVYDFVTKKSDKITLRIRRIYFILLVGMVSTMLASLVKGDAAAICSITFSVCYAAFLPLAFMVGETVMGECECCKKYEKAAKIISYVCLGLVVVCFGLSIPATYGFALSQSAANGLFGWMSFVSNGFFR